MIAPLLTTKLNIPPVRPELVSRLHLIERLNAGMARKLTLFIHPGWIWQDDVANFMRAFTGSDRYILDYFVKSPSTPTQKRPDLFCSSLPDCPTKKSPRNSYSHCPR